MSRIRFRDVFGNNLIAEVRQRMKEAPVTSVIMVICVAVFLLVNFAPMGSLGTTEKGIFLGAYYKAFISAGEWWRLLTVGFVHINFFHLLMNMYSFYILGPAMEREYGHLRYGILLAGATIGGSLFQFISGGNTVAVGLSGGLYGLMAAFFMMVIREGGWDVPQYRSMIINTLIINLAINFMGGVAYRAHIGGFVVGMMLAEILSRDYNKTLKRNTAIAAIALAVVLGVFSFRSSAIHSNEQYAGTDIAILKYEKDIGLSRYAEYLAGKLDVLYGTQGIEQWVKEN